MIHTIQFRETQHLPLLKFIQMHTLVHDDSLSIRIFGLRKSFKLADIKHAEVQHYRPIRDYGGWGWRWNMSKGQALMLQGKEGVMLELSRNRKLLLGSSDPDALLAAIQGARTALSA